MAKSPAFPKDDGTKYDPFLCDGTTEVEILDAFVKDGPPEKPIPSHVFKVKPIKSTNPMNALGATHEVRIKCQGYSWGKHVQEIVSSAGLIPKVSISAEVSEALYQTGKLKGRKLEITQVTKSNEKGATWREYTAKPLETKSVI